VIQTVIVSECFQLVRHIVNKVVLYQ